MRSLGARWKRPKRVAGYCCLHRIPSRSRAGAMVPQAMGPRQIKAKDCLNAKRRRKSHPCPHFLKKKDHPMWAN